MSDNIIARNKIEIAIDGDGVDAGIAKIDKSIKGLSQAAAAAGRDASKGINEIGNGGTQAAAGVDRATKNIIGSIQRQTLALQAGSRSSADYYKSIADLKGANLDVLRPYINQLKEAEAQADKLTASNVKIGDSFSNLGNVAGIAKAAIATLAGLSLVAVIKDVTILAARYDELGIVMGVVGRNSGITKSQLESQELALRKTGISMLESRSSITKLISANIDLAKATELARIAQDAAVIGGVNSSQAFATLVDGIQTAQVETVRTLGLNVNFESSYTKLAATLGKTSDKLTEYEKTQARVNAVLALSPNIAGAYEASLDNAGKQIRSSTRYVEDFKVKVGETFNEALTIGVMGFTSSLKDVNGQVDELAASGKLKLWGDGIVETMAFVADSVTSVGTVFELTGSHMAEFFAIRSSLNGFLGGQDAIGIRAAAEEDRNQIIKSASAFRDALAERRKALEASAKAKDPMLEQMMADNAEFEKYVRQNAEIAAQAAADAAKAAMAKAKQVATQQENILKSIEVMKVENNLISQGVPLQDARTIAQLKANSATDAMIVSTLNAQQANAKLIETQKFEQDFYDNFEKSIVSQGEALDKQVESILASAGALEDENKNYGKLPSAITDVTIARLRDNQAMLEGKGLVVPEIEAQIKAYQKLKAAQFAHEDLDRNKKAEDDRVAAAKKSADEIARVYEKTSDQINQSLTDALLRGFEAGKTFAQNFRDSLVNMFKTLILRPVISMIVNPVSATIATALGTSPASAATNALGSSSGSSLSSVKGIFDLISNGNSSIVSGIESLGATLSNGLGGLRDSIGGFIGANSAAIADGFGYAGALIALSQGNIATAIGTGIGTYFGGPIGGAIGSVVGGFVDSLFGGHEKTTFSNGALVYGSSDANGKFTNGKFNAGSADTLSNVNDLQKISASFTSVVSGLLTSFGKQASIDTVAHLLEVTDGNKYNAFNASLNGKTVGFGGQDNNLDTKAYVEKIFSETVVQAIQSSDLSSSIKGLFGSLTTSTQVNAMILATTSLNAAQAKLADSFGLTVDKAAEVANATGLVGDALTSFVSGLVVASGASSATSQLISARGTLQGLLGQDLPETLKAFDNIIKGIDKSNASGINQVVSLLNVRAGFEQYTNAIDALKSGVKSSLLGVVSSADKQAMLNADLEKAFNVLGLAVPTSIQDLITLGQSIDFTSASGLDLAAVFPSLVTAFVNTKGAVDDLMNSMRDVNNFTSAVDFNRYKGLAANYGSSFANNYTDGQQVTYSNSVNTPVTTLNVTPSNNTTISTSDPNLLEAIKTLTAQVLALQASSDRTADNTKRAADTLVNVSPNGNAIQTEAVV